MTMPETIWASKAGAWDPLDASELEYQGSHEYVLQSSVQGLIDEAVNGALAEAAAKLLAVAGQEYVLAHVMETDWHRRQGRHSAVRGMIVRMGLYAELEGAIDAALTKIGGAE